MNEFEQIEKLYKQYFPSGKEMNPYEKYAVVIKYLYEKEEHHYLIEYIIKNFPTNKIFAGNEDTHEKLYVDTICFAYATNNILFRNYVTTIIASKSISLDKILYKSFYKCYIFDAKNYYYESSFFEFYKNNNCIIKLIFATTKTSWDIPKTRKVKLINMLSKKLLNINDSNYEELRKIALEFDAYELALKLLDKQNKYYKDYLRAMIIDAKEHKAKAIESKLVDIYTFEQNKSSKIMDTK